MSTRRSVCSSVLILELVLPAAAQIVSYEIPGTVKDPTGTAMVRAQVTALGLEARVMRFFNVFKSSELQRTQQYAATRRYVWERVRNLPGESYSLPSSHDPLACGTAAGNAGRIFGIVTSTRQIQFGVKLIH